MLWPILDTSHILGSSPSELKTLPKWGEIISSIGDHNSFWQEASIVIFESFYKEYMYREKERKDVIKRKHLPRETAFPRVISREIHANKLSWKGVTPAFKICIENLQVKKRKNYLSSAQMFSRVERSDILCTIRESGVTKKVKRLKGIVIPTIKEPCKIILTKKSNFSASESKAGSKLMDVTVYFSKKYIDNLFVPLAFFTSVNAPLGSLLPLSLYSYIYLCIFGVSLTLEIGVRVRRYAIIGSRCQNRALGRKCRCLMLSRALSTFRLDGRTDGRT